MIVAVIPLKSLATAKSRLAGVLSDEERRRLVIEMLERVVCAVRESGCVEQIALVTPEKWLAEELGLVHLADQGDMNRSVASGVQWALNLSAKSLVILPADLPLVVAADVRAFLRCDRILAPCRLVGTRDGGTGALLLTPPDALSPSFGTGSMRAHTLLAAARGVVVDTLDLRGLAVDLDTPDDLSSLSENRMRNACRVP